MSAAAGLPANLPNEVPVIALKLESLRPFVADDRAPISFADLQAALGLDHRSAKKAVGLLIRLEYLTEKRTKPLRYLLTEAVLKALTPPSGRAISRKDAWDAVSDLVRVVGEQNRAPEGPRISGVKLFGAILDDSAENLPYAQAQVTVNVLPSSERTNIQMRRIEEALWRASKSLHVSFVLNST